MNNESSKYEAELIQAISKHKWMRWKYIQWEKLSFGRSTAYNHGLDKLDTIKEAFEDNRTEGVNDLIQNWIKSNNPTLQIAAMRIIADNETRQCLNQQYIEHSGAVQHKVIWPNRDGN
jgi:hypothetical protein